MSRSAPVTVDFETLPIEGRPNYPPPPVGVSIKYSDRAPRYYAWGHINGGNNCTWAEAKRALEVAWRYRGGLLFHNSKFDVDVAEIHMGLPLPHWKKIHDTLFMAYLDDPRRDQLRLKPLAEQMLGMASEERDLVGEWLLSRKHEFRFKLSTSVNSPNYFGAYVAFAPGDLVGEYANGDVIRTEAIYDALITSLEERGMTQAYDRERELMPILLSMERTGVPVDLPRLRHDVDMYLQWREKINDWIKTRVKAKDINLDSGSQLMAALVSAGKVDKSQVPRTATGKFKSDKETFLTCVNDQVLLAALTYRTQLNTCLNTFMIPWLETATRSGGLIFTTWNQTRSPAGDSTVGTRTGRLSSTPNFQNIPNEFKDTFSVTRGDGLPALPAALRGLPPLPHVRAYVVPFHGDVLIDRDYSQQELRILAHYDGGSLLKKYAENPWVDLHDDTRDELGQMGLHYDRKPVKNTNFGIIYGMGVGKLAIKNGMTVEDASTLKKAIMTLYPGLKDMYSDMRYRASDNIPIKTWGGREYYCEEPRIVDGRIQKYDYKLVNLLIQGSAADCTKEAIIKFERVRISLKAFAWKLLLNVHDQVTASVPTKDLHQAMTVLRECMEGVMFDVPMLTEGKVSHTNWFDLVDYDKKGQLVA